MVQRLQSARFGKEIRGRVSPTFKIRSAGDGAKGGQRPADSKANGVGSHFPSEVKNAGHDSADALCQ